MASWKLPHRTFVTLDGHKLPVEIARLTNTEYASLKFGLQRGKLPQRGTPIRRPEEMEETLDPKTGEKHFALTDDDLQQLRIFELPEVEHQRLIRNMELASEAYARMCDHSIRTYVRLPQPWTHPSEGIEVTSIDDLLEYYGTRDLTVAALINAIWIENSLPSDVKNALSLRADSTPGSRSKDAAVTGPGPDAVAPSAES